MTAFLVALGIVVALIAGLLGLGALRPAAAEEPPPKSSKKSGSTRAEVQAQLEALAVTPVERELSTGAKCYKQAAPPQTADFVCPVCGERTSYGRDEAPFLERDLPELRRCIAAIDSVAIKLDETAFCSHCTPGEAHPRLALEITYDGESTPHRVEKLSERDVELVCAFFAGSDVYTGSYGNEQALREFAPRLEELLGVDAPSVE